MTTIDRRRFVKTAGLTAAGAALSGMRIQGAEKRTQRPNILWLTAEDLSPHLGCYGDSYAYTPNLDRMAAQGVRYDNAYATAPVCTPARSSIITGVYASSLGTQHLRGEMPLAKDIHCFTEYLRESGYYCSNNVKEDYNFKTPDNAWDESSNKAHWRGRKADQPFFSVFNFMTTHQSRTRYPAEELEEVNKTLKPKERHDPAKAPLPPYYPDTPAVRTNVAVFYTQVTLLDKQVKELLDQLEEDGLAQDTIVFFYGDHGDGLPRGKRWLHESGMKVPFIIRFPKKYQHLAPGKPGSAVKEMISFADLAPTMLSVTGIDIPNYIQGRAFLGEAKKPEPEYLFGIRDRVDEVLELSRSVRDKKYLYIRNFYPHRARMQRSFYAEITPIRKELRRLDQEGELYGDEEWLMQDHVPPEELYDLEADPHQMNNLIDAPYSWNVPQRFRKELMNWIIETKDTAFLPEQEMIRRSKGGSPYDMARKPGVYPIERILEVADRIGRGKKHIAAFQEALKDPDCAVRYWGANGLAASATFNRNAEPAIADLREALNDESAPVRYAAAEAMCKLGHEDEAVPVLIEGLEDDDVKNNLHASMILMVIGEKAKAAVPQMKETLKRLEGLPDRAWYTRENLQFMIEKLSE